MEEITENKAVEVVKPDQILKSAGLDEKKSVSIGTWEQQSGLKLAWAVGGLAAVIILVILVNWWLSMPAPPKLTSSLTPDQIDTALKAYKSLAEESTDRALRLFDSFVVKPLLPIFSTIIGYIIAHRSSKGWFSIKSAGTESRKRTKASPRRGFRFSGGLGCRQPADRWPLTADSLTC